MAVSPETLAAMTRQIVAEVNPRRVLLFGSQARGDARSDSDVDLMLICDGPFSRDTPRRAISGRLYRNLRGYGVSKDILVMTPDEYERLSKDKNHCASRVAREGRVLYERQ